MNLDGASRTLCLVGCHCLHSKRKIDKYGRIRGCIPDSSAYGLSSKFVVSCRFNCVKAHSGLAYYVCRLCFNRPLSQNMLQPASVPSSFRFNGWTQRRVSIQRSLCQGFSLITRLMYIRWLSADLSPTLEKPRKSRNSLRPITCFDINYIAVVRALTQGTVQDAPDLLRDIVRSRINAYFRSKYANVQRPVHPFPSSVSRWSPLA